MGLSSSSQKTETRPIYEGEIKQAYSNLNGAYNTAAPKISAITDQMATIAPGLLQRYTQGDPGVNAARKYNTSVLNGDYLNAGNPYFDSVVAQTGADARNQTAAALGLRGLNGGSSFADLVSRNVANATGQLRYNQYEAERARMGQAASMAGSLDAAQYLPIGVMQQIAEAQGMPLSAASGAAGAVGGLLGSYTSTNRTMTPSFLDALGQAVNIGTAAVGLGKKI